MIIQLNMPFGSPLICEEGKDGDVSYARCSLSHRKQIRAISVSTHPYAVASLARCNLFVSVLLHRQAAMANLQPPPADGIGIANLPNQVCIIDIA